MALPVVLTCLSTYTQTTLPIVAAPREAVS